MKHQLRILKISKGMNAQTSRYRANPIWDPQPWLKPVNTEHNLEPSRLNPTLVDEYDK